jgi:branched-chain amino acid transport system substrate-binding protein
MITSVTGCSCGGFNQQSQNKAINSSETATSFEPKQISTQISQGNTILITQDTTPEKQAAVKAIATGDYPQAVSQLEQSLAQQSNDPEALIYLNNARIAEGQAYSLAVPVPIGTEITTAQEILRGVAQAQTSINQQGGINGVPLKITIANDDNKAETAQQVAQSLVDNQEILGVIGHFSSEISLTTAPIYQQNGLVAISATSTSTSLSDAGNYIFRTVPSDRSTSKALAQYAISQFNLDQAAVIYNSQSDYSQSQKDIFTADLVNSGGDVVLETDLSRENFNPVEVLQEAGREGATVLVFLNDSKTVDRAYLLMQLNERQLPMLGGNSIFKPQTLQIGGEKAVGMVLAVPWHISSSTNSDFLSDVERLWGGEVGWRTAMAYDATKALSVGLSHDPSRQGIQQTLSQSNLAFEGASGTVKFLPSGDRNQEVQLVQVQPGKNSSFGYDFMPLKLSTQ